MLKFKLYKQQNHMKKILFVLTYSFAVFSFTQDIASDDVHTGEGTYYDIVGSTDAFGGLANCSFDHSQISPFYIGAMNETDYANADYCGACIEIEGPIGSVRVKIIDRCPECQPGDIDLSPEAFDQIAARIDGRVPISWTVVPCEVTGPVVMYFKEGSTQYWTAIQIRNHKTPIATLAYYKDGQWINMPRERYNYFVEAGGTTITSFDIKITDIYGEEIIQTVNEIVAEVEIQGTEQLPDRIAVAVEEIVEKASSQISYQESTLNFNDLTGQYQIIDLSGRIITTGSTETENTLILDQGIYIVKLASGDTLISQKILVE